MITDAMRTPTAPPAAPARGSVLVPRVAAGDVVAWAARLAAATAHDTVLRRFLLRVATHPEQVAYRVLAAGGAPVDAAFTWREWAAAARAAAAALVSGGLQRGEVVAILAGNRPLWPILDVAVLMAGGASLGIIPTSTGAQVEAMLADARARVVIVDEAEQLAKVLPGGDRLVVAEHVAREGVPTLERWIADGAAALARPALAAEVDARILAACPDDLAVLIYTSGSTGEPKGACLSHAYLLASAESVRDTLGLTDADASLSLLPYGHAAERLFGLYTRLVCGMTGGLVLDARRVWDAMAAFRPTLLGGLPRFYEKLHDALCAAERAATGEAAAAWARLREVGAQRSALRRGGVPVPAELEREWQRVRAPAAAVLQAHVGDALRLATSGGAPLPLHVAELLDAAGLTVLGAYGQTEHLCIAFHRPAQYDFAGVGRPMPGTELRIAEDDEILVRRCALTFSGYLHRPEETRAAFTADGAWLHTGDLGAIDAHGVLHVTGRKKEILALSTGKKVAPLPIEERLRAHPLVQHAVVAGEGRRYAVALLFAPEARDEAARASIEAHVAAINASLAPHERVVRHVVLAAALTQEQGEITPTLKVRRGVVTERWADALEALYA